MSRALIMTFAALSLTLALGCGQSETDTSDVAAEPAKEMEGTEDAVASAVAECLALAADGEYAKSLSACERAAAETPNDMRVEHALQQARAAAEN